MAAKNYSVSGPNASGASNKTLISLKGATTVRPSVYDVLVGCTATPADQAMQFYVDRFGTTDAGTAGSAPTPQPLDSATVAAATVAGITHSGEPTSYLSTPFLDIRMNQRATFRWVAAPGSEFTSPATANTGIGLYLVAATAALIAGGTVLFFE